MRSARRPIRPLTLNGRHIMGQESSFTELMTAPAERLVNIFYRVRQAPTDDMVVKVDWAATQLRLNHAQLVCALGFNSNVHELTDILSSVGFSSYEQLAGRRDELFSSDTYEDLSIDNVLDLYSERLEDARLLASLRELLPARLAAIERLIGRTDNPGYVVSYKMEVHAVYNGGIATGDLARERLKADIGQYRLLTDEAALIAETALVSPTNILFMKNVLPDEKQLLIGKGLIPSEVIRNRASVPDIAPEEREMLNRFLIAR